MLAVNKAHGHELLVVPVSAKSQGRDVVVEMRGGSLHSLEAGGRVPVSTSDSSTVDKRFVKEKLSV